MGSLIDEVPNKQSLENGYHVSSSGNMPTYKKRKVSATRRFPPNCGTNAELISPEALLDVIVCIDDSVGLSDHVNYVQTTIGVEVDSDAVERNGLVASEFEALGERQCQGNVVVQHVDSVDVAVEDKGVGTEPKIEVGTEPKIEVGTEPKIAEEFFEAKNSDDLGLPTNSEEHDVHKVDCSKSTSEVEVQIREAVESPISVEGNVSLDDMVGDAVAMVMDSIGNVIEGRALAVKPLQAESLEDMEGISADLMEVNGKEAEVRSGGEHGVKTSGEIDVVATSEIPVSVRAFQTPKDKFRPRKVSASRDFPPHCGKNASPYAQEELSKIFYEAGSEEIEGNLTDVAFDDNYNQGDEFLGKEFRLDVHATSSAQIPSHENLSSEFEDERVIVNALMAAPYCPWSQEKVKVTSNGKAEGRVNKRKAVWQQKPKAFAKKSIVKADGSNRSSIKKQKHSLSDQKDAAGTSHALVVRDEGNSVAVEKGPWKGSPTSHKNSFTVNFPPFGASSGHNDARSKVRETLRLFQTICRKLLQGEEAKSGQSDKIKRIDLEAAKILKEKGIEINTDKDPVGSVPGVEVGDEFQYRVELAVVGVHRLYQGGIDYFKLKDGTHIATSIVASGAYADGWDNADVLIYSGQGGNVVGKKKEPEDQKLERGNLALANSKSKGNPVRVIRGSKETKASDSLDSRSKAVTTTYVYDGLYIVEKYWQETGPHGKLVYMYELRRILGQPELAWKEVKNAKRAKAREGVCVKDISGGKEPIPICAVNTIDDEKPSPFTYIRKMKYPDGFKLRPPEGCNCSTRCSDSRKCPCKLRNGGAIPYNHNGAIVEVKPIVYECGPSCKCPPSCYNRVSQHGIKIQLEIFKTENRGWGVRSLASITSGSFICEYAGELLEDKEAEQRTGSDEYLFDIGKNSIDPGKNSIDPSSLSLDGKENLDKGAEEGGYTVDAAIYGNVGRFINHSCSPNLYAQDVVYDHDDKRMPHVMLFAAENIPPMQELTYDYNYSVNQVRDSDGNIKKKNCYCGSADCTGRLY